MFLECLPIFVGYTVVDQISNDNDNDNDKIFYSTLIIHFIFNTAIDVFAY